MLGDISKLKRLRTGEPMHSIVTIGNGDNSVPVAIVLLNVDTSLKIEEMTEEYCQINKNKVNSNVRTQYYNRLLVYECMRDPSNLSIKMTENPAEVAELLDPEDIQRICKAYNELMVDKSPKLELLTDEELDKLKKYLEVTSLKDLSTMSQIHLKSFHLTIPSKI